MVSVVHGFIHIMLLIAFALYTIYQDLCERIASFLN